MNFYRRKDLHMIISKQKQYNINNEIHKIHKSYVSALERKGLVCQKINELLCFQATTPLTAEQLLGKSPKGIDSKKFKVLANKHILYTAQAEQCKQNMVKLFNPIINDILESKYSSYPGYRNQLYQAGVIGVRLSMGQIYSDPYVHYCQRIVVEMHRFLNDNGLIQL